jgi:hypothetical protein
MTPDPLRPPAPLRQTEQRMAEQDGLGTLVGTHRNHAHIGNDSCFYLSLLVGIGGMLLIAKPLGVDLAEWVILATPVTWALLKLASLILPPRSGRIWVWLHDGGLVLNLGGDDLLPLRWSDLTYAVHNQYYQSSQGREIRKRFAHVRMQGNMQGADFDLTLVHFTGGAKLYPAVVEGLKKHA